jgi:hypothetical protein
MRQSGLESDKRDYWRVADEIRGFFREWKNRYQSFLIGEQQSSIRMSPEFGFISLKG